MLRFKTLSYIDRACTGMEAFSMLVPSGWMFEGGMRWSMEDTMMPAVTSFKISGDGVTLQVLPGRAFFWINLPYVRASHPVGSKYLGAMVCPPLEPFDVIKDIILPTLGPDAASVKIIEEWPLDRMEGTLGFGIEFKSYSLSSSKGARIRLEYIHDGLEMEEEIFCTVTVFNFTVPAGSGEIVYAFWMADHMYSFSAEKGKLDESMGVLQTIMHSFKLNPQWFDKYNRIVMYLKDRQVYRQHSLRQLSIDIDKEPRANDDITIRSYGHRHAVYKWIAGRLDHGEHTGEYYDPIQQICVRLPSGYDHAWASETGEYLLSNKSDFQPDSGFTEI